MSRPRALRSLALALGLLLAATLPVTADGPFRLVILRLDASDYPNVQIVASVVDADGKPVKGLTPSDIAVSENGVAQTAIVELASQTAPVAIALALDTSGSMSGRPMADAKRALTSLTERLGPSDRALLVTFSQEARVAQALTADKDALNAATQAAVAGGNTAIYDAVALAVDALRDLPRQTRSAIVLLTDGFDTSSKISREEAVARAAGAGHPVYAVGVGNDIDRASLEALAASVRGGQAFVAPTSEQLAGIYASLSEQILTQYTIRYRSTAVTAIDETALQVGLRLARDGASRGEASAAYAVPPGRGAPVATPVAIVPAAEPARVEPRATVEPVTTVGAPTLPGRPALVGALGAVAVFVLLLWVADVAAPRARLLRRRLQSFVPQATVKQEGLWTRASVRPLKERLRSSVLAPVGRRLASLTPGGLMTSTGQRLEQAGAPLGLEAVDFFGLRAGATLLGALAVLGLLWINGSSLEIAIGGVVLGLVLGYAAPDYVLARMIRRRKTEILRVLPSTLDMLALSVEAGLAFDGAIAQVAHRQDNALSDEFRRLLVEFQMGRQRRQALREMARRTATPEVARFTNAVTQADALGAPLAKVLHDLAAELRTKRRQRAEELARTAPIKMLFPMVLLIFPALFVVVLGPAVPRVLAVFSSAAR